MPIDPTEIRSVGRYPVVRFLAEGGFSWVFEVLDPELGVHRALKMLKPWVESEADLVRFRAEARQLAALNAPELVQIFELAKDPATGCPYFTMALIDGPNLGQLLREHRESGAAGLPLHDTRAIFVRVLSGLAQLHARGIVHRDIKPANVFVSRDGRAFLGDLGIARMGSSGLTRTGVAMGTALYMSPEQARGREVSPASDIFSIGLCLYEALEGRSVYEGIRDLDTSSGSDVIMYLGSLLHARRDLELQLSETTPAPLRRVIERACHVDPAERYPDAQAMLDDLVAAFEKTDEERIDWGRLISILLVASGIAAAVFLWPRAPGPSERAQAPLPAETAQPPSEAVPAAPPTAPLAEPAEPPPKPRPPELVARVPTGEKVELEAGKRIELGVEARDPDGGSLQYAWLVDGRPVAGSTASLALEPTADAVVEVQVRNPAGEQVTARWAVRVLPPASVAPPVNEPPTLSVAPRQPGAVYEGQSVEFVATARDPEGQTLTYEFLVDEAIVRRGRSSRYVFEPPSAGSYTVSVRVVDPAGKAALERRRVEVRPNRAPTLALAGPEGPLQVGATGEFRATPSDPDPGDQPAVEFRLNGHPVATGTSYVFAATSAGEYRVSAVATDRAGTRSGEETRLVRVTSPETPSAPPSGGDLPAIKAEIDSYQKAVATCDTDAIDNVVKLSRVQKRMWEVECSKCAGDLAPITAYRDTDVQISGEQAEVSLVLITQCLDEVRRNRQRANLVRRGGVWDLVSVY